MRINNIKTKEAMLDVYSKMLLIRKVEEKINFAYTKQEVRGFCHLYIGQEAVVTGFWGAMQQGDSSITSYRCHAHYILFADKVKELFAELMQKDTGASRGKGGSMHLFDTDNKFFGGHGIVGAQIPLGTGIAFAEKYNETNNVCVAFMGDGAANQGQVYEAINMAVLWDIPVIYVLENNQYSMGTSVARHAKSGDFTKRAEGFGMKAFKADGMNVQAVYEVAKEATEYTRSNKKPCFVQLDTYRFKGHSVSDPATYRTKDELEEYKSNDPVTIAENILRTEFNVTEEKFKEISSYVKNEVKEGYGFGQTSNFPSLSELETDVL